MARSERCRSVPPHGLSKASMRKASRECVPLLVGHVEIAALDLRTADTPLVQ